MTRWLYNSDGGAVAYISGEYVYSRLGDFIGKLYPDQTVWNGNYIGTIMADDRFFYKQGRLFEARGLPGMPTLPGFVGDPPFRGPHTVPLGYRDVDIK